VQECLKEQHFWIDQDATGEHTRGGGHLSQAQELSPGLGSEAIRRYSCHSPINCCMLGFGGFIVCPLRVYIRNNKNKNTEEIKNNNFRARGGNDYK